MNKKLTDLNPRFVGAGGVGVFRLGEKGNHVPVPERTGVGVSFDCPCGCGTRCFVPFSNPIDGGIDYAGGGPAWNRTGETFEDMTLTPSILRLHGCGWHGFLTNGELATV